MTASAPLVNNEIAYRPPPPAPPDLSTSFSTHPNAANHAESMGTLLPRLIEIINERRLSVLFQPIIGMHKADIVGYEGLVRGPSDSPLHSPLNLFKVANANGMNAQLEKLCCEVVSHRFAQLNLPGKLFLNVGPESLLRYDGFHSEIFADIRQLGVDPDRIIIELTENQPTYDYDLLRQAATFYRSKGFRIAIDDLGEGFSSLRLWSELRPEYVKIDMHFIQGLNQDPVKLQFVRSIHEIAKECGSMAIAEGIENQTELLMIRDIGIPYGQGYHIARPSSSPASLLPTELVKSLNGNGIAFYPRKSATEHHIATASKLLTPVEPVRPGMTQ